MEEAFYTTDRVMTASFHRFGEFFPGTGDVRVSFNGFNFGIGYGPGLEVRGDLLGLLEVGHERRLASGTRPDGSNNGIRAEI